MLINMPKKDTIIELVGFYIIITLLVQAVFVGILGLRDIHIGVSMVIALFLVAYISTKAGI